jgi:hypothetical protein
VKNDVDELFHKMMDSLNDIFTSASLKCSCGSTIFKKLKAIYKTTYPVELITFIYCNNCDEFIARYPHLKRVSETRSLKSLAGNNHNSGTLTIRRVLDVFLTSLNKVRGFYRACLNYLFKSRNKGV